jgi:hypothetical protein
MSIQTFGTVLIWLGAILGIAAGICIALGIIPIFDDYKKRQQRPTRKGTPSRGAGPASGSSDTPPIR